MSERKPAVDPIVPTYAIDRRLGRVHVGTPDAEVEALVAEAIATAEKGPEGAQWTPKIKRQTIRYAIWRHHRNLAEYRRVMYPGRSL